MDEFKVYFYERTNEQLVCMQGTTALFINACPPAIWFILFSKHSTVLPAKSGSDAMFCLQSYQGFKIDRSLVY